MYQKLMVVLTALAVVFGMFGSPAKVFAQDDVPPPPEPIIVTSDVTEKTSAPGDVQPNAVVTDPGGGNNSVTITNLLWSMWQGAVKSAGSATANFNQASSSRITCASSVKNSANQTGTTTTSNGSYGGNSCPQTAQASLSGVVPATYTTWTTATFKWPSGVTGSGKAEQSYYQN